MFSEGINCCLERFDMRSSLPPAKRKGTMDVISKRCVPAKSWSAFTGQVSRLLTIDGNFGVQLSTTIGRMLFQCG